MELGFEGYCAQIAVGVEISHAISDGAFEVQESAPEPAAILGLPGMCGRGIPGTVVMVLPSRFPSDRIAGEVATRRGPSISYMEGPLSCLLPACAISPLRARAVIAPRVARERCGHPGLSSPPSPHGRQCTFHTDQRLDRFRPIALDQSRVRVTRSRQDARAISSNAIPPSTPTSGSTSTSVAPCRPISVNASIAQACGVMWATLFMVEL